MTDDLRPYQSEGVRRILDGSTGLFFKPGLGKTATTLRAVEILSTCRPGFRTLVIAPLPVVLNTWTEEVEKWSPGLRVAVCYGSKRVAALRSDADVYLLNAENVFWFFDEVLRSFDRFPFDLLVLDESTLFKNWTAKRTVVLRKFRELFPRVVILTGTPTPKNIGDLFSQVYFLDGGKRLGKTLTGFRSRFGEFGGYKNKQWSPFPGSLDRVRKLVEDVVLYVDRETVVNMPSLLDVVVPVVLPPEARRVYDQFEKALFAELDGEEVFVPSRSHNYGVCRQIAAGGLYRPPGLFREVERTVYGVHRAKIEAVERLVGELYGEPLLLAYLFEFNRPQLEKIGASVPFGPDKQGEISRLKKRFLSGDLSVLAVHPASVSHGLNLHTGPGRSVAWLSPPNSLEHYIQLNERIYRPGVDSPVTIFHFVAVDTIEETVLDVLRSGAVNQESFLNGLRRRRIEKKRD